MGRGFAARRPVIGCLVATVTLGAAAACTAGGGSPTSPSSGTRASAPTSPASAPATASGRSGPVPALPARALASPGCSGATAAGAALGSAGTSSVQAGSPFGVAATPDGRWAFAVSSASGSVVVLRLGSGTGPAPAVTKVRSIPLSSAADAGAAVTPDGKYLLVAEGSGAVVISVARAEAGAAGAVLGSLTMPSPTEPRGTAGAGSAGAAADLDSAIEVAVSPDSRFAFVTLEYADEAAVFDLADTVAHGFGAADYVGVIPLGQAAVGMAVSPDGRWLYATSEAATSRQQPTGLGSPGGCQGRVPGTSPGESPGTLSVINLRQAETDPAQSVTATVDAGYQPVRVVTAADGTEVWVTARASDDVLCFAAARLAADPAHALVAVTRVGSEPVGLAAVRGGTLLVVADSNRFGATGANADLSVVSVPAALAGRPAVLGNLASGQFPRDMAVSPSGTLLVSDFSSGQVQAIATAALPSGS
jgi:DNA-binding beta-propeller fold protein YncE